MMVLSYYGALGTKTDLLVPYFGQRYYYAPQVLLGLTLLGIARSRQLANQLAAVMVGWLLVSGVVQYTSVHPYMGYGPSWRGEIAQWRNDPSHRIVLWPVNVQVSLPANH